MPESDFHKVLFLHSECFKGFRELVRLLSESQDKGGHGMPLNIVSYECLHLGVLLMREVFGPVALSKMLRSVADAIDRGRDDPFEDINRKQEADLN